MDNTKYNICNHQTTLILDYFVPMPIFECFYCGHISLTEDFCIHCPSEQSQQ